MYIPLDIKVKTDGNGLWSSIISEVHIKGMVVNDFDGDYGEVRFYFDTETWNVYDCGLIYTDPQFIKELQVALYDLMGISADDFDYSEQGMQGIDYVSCDIKGDFISKARKYYEKIG